MVVRGRRRRRRCRRGVASPATANATAPAVSDAAKSPAAPATARPPAAAASPPASSPPSRFLFSERPLPLALLAVFDAEGDLAVADVVLDPRNRWKDVKLKVLLAGGKLDVPSFTAAAYGGTLADGSPSTRRGRARR